MTQSEQIEFASTVFQALVSDSQDRLARGAMLREAMHAAVRRGEKPVGYRPDWIREKSVQLCSILADWGEAFNQQHANDSASVGDLLDIIATAASLLNEDDEEEEG